MNNQPVIITSEGLIQLQKDLDELVQVKRPALVERLSIARSMGDLSENSDYQSAKEELGFLDGRISELEDLIKNAQVAAPTGKDQVSVGNKVTVKIQDNHLVYHIVGEWEADPTQKKISASSPLGLALMGKKIGDVVEVAAPAGKILYTVVSID